MRRHTTGCFNSSMAFFIIAERGEVKTKHLSGHLHERIERSMHTERDTVGAISMRTPEIYI